MSGANESDSMKGTRFSEEQVIAILKEHEVGMPTADLCRRTVVGCISEMKFVSMLICRRSVAELAFTPTRL